MFNILLSRVYRAGVETRGGGERTGEKGCVKVTFLILWPVPRGGGGRGGLPGVRTCRICSPEPKTHNTFICSFKKKKLSPAALFFSPTMFPRLASSHFEEKKKSKSPDLGWQLHLSVCKSKKISLIHLAKLQKRAFFFFFLHLSSRSRPLKCPRRRRGRNRGSKPSGRNEKKEEEREEICLRYKV